MKGSLKKIPVTKKRLKKKKNKVSSNQKAKMKIHLSHENVSII